MRKFVTFLLFNLMITAAFAQGTITGAVLDADSGEELIGATVLVKGTNKGAATDFDGSFTLEGVEKGTQTLVFSYTGYSDLEQTVEVTDGVLELGLINMSANVIGLEEVKVIASIAIDRKTPVAVSNISAQEIEAKLGNQEFPEVLKSTPSIYTTKSGGGFGDARITVRGFAQEDIALLINGIPVNGMEDNKVYWSNWAGLGDVTRTIQVQRGLGASKLAVASVGGTINILTKTTDQEKGGALSTSIGNNGYRKTGLTLSTGRTEKGWAVTFSGSRTTGDGYIEGTYIDAWSYFGSIAKEIGTNQQLMFTIFGAPQRHGQRNFEHSIAAQRNTYGERWNDDFGSYQGRDFLIRDNFYHKPQASLNHIWTINENTNLITAVYGSVGRGGGTGDLGGFLRSPGRYNEREFRQAKDEYGHQQFDEFFAYNTGQENTLYDTTLTALYTIGAGADTLGNKMIGIAARDRRNPEAGENGMIKRASMNEHEWYGVLSTLTHDLNSNISITGGIDARWYHGSHYRKTIDLFGLDYWLDRDNINQMDDWVDMNGDGVKDANEMGNLVRPTNDASRFFGSVDDDEKIDYSNDEDINWYGVFGQVEYNKDKISTFLSGAVNLTTMRRYDFFNKRPENELTDWFSFIGGNIKTGANYNINATNNVFLNVGFISRAPYFDALFPTFNNDEANEDAQNEKVISAELGYGFRDRDFKLNINGYFTQWKDKTQVETFRTSEDLFFLNLLGLDATHMGIEMDFNWKANNRLDIRGFASLNNWEWKNNPEGTITDEGQNVIGTATYFIDGLKVGDAAQTTLGIGAAYNFGSGLSADIQYNYSDNLYASYNPADRDVADNAGLQPLQLPSFSLVDLGVTWKFKFIGMDANARLNVNNLFNEEYVTQAFDGADLESTNGWFGFRRTWNASMKFNF